MRKVLVWRMVLMVWLCQAAALRADYVAGLFAAREAVSSQSPQELRRAAVAGLKAVFVRVSGHAASLDNADINRALDDASSFIKQFQYAIDDEQQMWVTLNFEPSLVEQQLRDAGLTIWSAQRPTVMLWLAVNESGQRRLLSAESAAELLPLVAEQAQRRGLALQVPLMDLQDSMAISAADIWSLDTWRAQQAGQRYQADIQLMGRVSVLSSGQWLGNWRLYMDGQRLDWDGDSASPEQYLQRAFAAMAEVLADKYAVSPVQIDAQGVLLSLDGIERFADYVDALSYLENLATVRAVQVVSVAGSQLLLRLAAEGQLSQLQRELLRGSRLVAVTGEAEQGSSADQRLFYRWKATAGQPLSPRGAP